jgi:hypothetical protein
MLRDYKFFRLLASRRISPQRGEMFIGQHCALGLRSGGAQQLATSWPNESTSRFLRSEVYLGVIHCYKHFAPLERKQIHLLHFKVESIQDLLLLHPTDASRVRAWCALVPSAFEPHKK